jgi:glutamine amidotransferase
MIVIVDYGVGNLRSVESMLNKAGHAARISSNPDEIVAADKIILPGVGKFDHGMNMIHESKLLDALNQFALVEKKPTLGICLGAQLLGKGSEEGLLAGLGWIDLYCRRLPSTPGLRVPHMGWNQLEMKKPSTLLPSDQSAARYYFVHSYYLDCEHREDVLATSRHGIEFACAVQRDNITGLQFHPEKSLRHGLAVVRAFAEG